MIPSRIQALSMGVSEWGLHHPWEDRLSELADYRKINGTAMFLETTAKTPSWLMGQTKGPLQVAPEGKKSNDLPVFRN
jgi:hypothetical protein